MTAGYRPLVEARIRAIVPDARIHLQPEADASVEPTGWGYRMRLPVTDELLAAHLGSTLVDALTAAERSRLLRYLCGHETGHVLELREGYRIPTDPRAGGCENLVHIVGNIRADIRVEYHPVLDQIADWAIDRSFARGLLWSTTAAPADTPAETIPEANGLRILYWALSYARHGSLFFTDGSRADAPTDPLFTELWPIVRAWVERARRSDWRSDDVEVPYLVDVLRRWAATLWADTEPSTDDDGADLDGGQTIVTPNAPTGADGETLTDPLVWDMPDDADGTQHADDDDTDADPDGAADSTDPDPATRGSGQDAQDGADSDTNGAAAPPNTADVSGPRGQDDDETGPDSPADGGESPDGTDEGTEPAAGSTTAGSDADDDDAHTNTVEKASPTGPGSTADPDGTPDPSSIGDVRAELDDDDQARLEQFEQALADAYRNTGLREQPEEDQVDAALQEVRKDPGQRGATADAGTALHEAEQAAADAERQNQVEARMANSDSVLADTADAAAELLPGEWQPGDDPVETTGHNARSLGTSLVSVLEELLIPTARRPISGRRGRDLDWRRSERIYLAAHDPVDTAPPIWLEDQPETTAESLALALVDDTSGSMSGEKKQAAHHSAAALLHAANSLDGLDVACAAFDHNLYVVRGLHSPRPLADALRLLEQAMSHAGNTRLALAVRWGLAQLRRGADPTQRQVLVVITDAETYSEEVGEVAAAVSRAQAEGITTIGIGLDGAHASALADMFPRHLLVPPAETSRLPALLRRLLVDVIREPVAS